MPDNPNWTELLAVAQASLKQSTRTTDVTGSRFGARILQSESWELFYPLVNTKKNSQTVPLYILLPPGVMKLLYYVLRDTDLISISASASDVLAEVIVDYCRIHLEGNQNENNRQINPSSGDGVSQENVVEQILSNDNGGLAGIAEINPDGSGISGS